MMLANQMPLQIATIEQYNEAVKMGYEPLIDWRFSLLIDLRIKIQYDLFCHSDNRVNIVKANDRFYHYCYEKSLKICQETGQPIHDYSSKVVSHIFSRSSHPELSYDPRNFNLLIPQMHAMWENEKKRKDMCIYRSNLILMEFLLKEYNY